MLVLEPPIDPRVQQALVGGAFLALGWVVSAWAARRHAARERAERVRDLQRALLAEIGTALANLGSEGRIAEETGAILKRMRDDPGFVPFIPRERPHAVWSEAVGKVALLPQVTIAPIVAFYAQAAALAALAEDMRAPAFARLDPDRRLTVYEDYAAMKRQALQFGRAAVHLIAVHAREGEAAAEREAERLRRVGLPPDTDPPGPDGAADGDQ